MMSTRAPGRASSAPTSMATWTSRSSSASCWVRPPLVIEAVSTVPLSREMAARFPTACSVEVNGDWGRAPVGSVLIETSRSVRSAPALIVREATRTCCPRWGPGRSTLRATRTAVPRQRATTRWRCRHSRSEGRPPAHPARPRGPDAAAPRRARGHPAQPLLIPPQPQSVSMCQRGAWRSPAPRRASPR